MPSVPRRITVTEQRMQNFRQPDHRLEAVKSCAEVGKIHPMVSSCPTDYERNDLQRYDDGRNDHSPSGHVKKTNQMKVKSWKNSHAQQRVGMNNSLDPVRPTSSSCMNNENESDMYVNTSSSRRQTDESLNHDSPHHIDPVKALSFPAKLHAILSRKDISDIVSWMPHGRSWRIHKPKAFEKSVIPQFFVHCKYSSFVRQVNGWGFRRITQGPDRNSYYHEFFLRGRLHLCQHMRRPGTSMKIPADPENEPNLYRLSELDPLPEGGPETQSDAILIDRLENDSAAAAAAGMTVATRRTMVRRLSSMAQKEAAMAKSFAQDAKSNLMNRQTISSIRQHLSVEPGATQSKDCDTLASAGASTAVRAPLEVQKLLREQESQRLISAVRPVQDSSMVEHSRAYGATQLRLALLERAIVQARLEREREILATQGVGSIPNGGIINGQQPAQVEQQTAGTTDRYGSSYSAASSVLPPQSVLSQPSVLADPMSRYDFAAVASDHGHISSLYDIERRTADRQAASMGLSTSNGHRLDYDPILLRALAARHSGDASDAVMRSI